MKLLYLSCDHSTLEKEVLEIFLKLDIQPFSTGIYRNPKKPNLEHAQRAPLSFEVDPWVANKFEELNPNRQLYSNVILTKEFVNKFDVIFCDHCCPNPNILFSNWEVIKHKPVIWRTYTQQNSQVELAAQQLRKQGLKIMRLSPKERNIPNYAGDDVIIRSPMEPEVYRDWNGLSGNVVTFNNFFSKRKYVSNTEEYLKIRSNFPNKFHLYGSYNEDSSISEGYLTWEEQKQKYRDASVYFALGSKPASLTYNFMEALLTGCPVVTWGRKLGNYFYSPEWNDTYEVPDLCENGKECFYSDDLKELEDYIRMLLTDRKLAETMSKNGREFAIKMWDKDTVINQWREFFNSIM